MSNRAREANRANHNRQLAYLREGIVMIPKLDKIFKLPKKARRK